MKKQAPAFPCRSAQARKRDIKKQIIIPSTPFERFAAPFVPSPVVCRSQPPSNQR